MALPIGQDYTGFLYPITIKNPVNPVLLANATESKNAVRYAYRTIDAVRAPSWCHPDKTYRAHRILLAFLNHKGAKGFCPQITQIFTDYFVLKSVEICVICG